MLICNLGILLLLSTFVSISLERFCFIHSNRTFACIFNLSFCLAFVNFVAHIWMLFIVGIVYLLTQRLHSSPSLLCPANLKCQKPALDLMSVVVATSCIRGFLFIYLRMHCVQIIILAGWIRHHQLLLPRRVVQQQTIHIKFLPYSISVVHPPLKERLLPKRRNS